MGKVYDPPKGIEAPKWDHKLPREENVIREHAFVEQVKAWAKEHGKWPEAGEEISFGVADGDARYIIVSLAPVVLIHLPLGDAYQYPFAHRLTAKDIRGMLALHHKVAAVLAKR
jgi:hypothetical protein